MNDQKNITLTITNDEALVLYEFLARFNEGEPDRPDIFEDQAEKKALWIIECLLQEQLVEPFKPDYMDLVYEARNKIRDEVVSWDEERQEFV